MGGTRLIVGYVAVALFLVAAVAVSVSVGRDEEPQPAIAGFYESDSGCLGERFSLTQSGQFVDVGGDAGGKLRFRDDELTGTADCVGGGTAAVELEVAGEGASAMLDRHGRRGARDGASSSRSCPSRERRPSRPRSGAARRRSGG